MRKFRDKRKRMETLQTRADMSEDLKGRGIQDRTGELRDVDALTGGADRGTSEWSPDTCPVIFNNITNNYQYTDMV